MSLFNITITDVSSEFARATWHFSLVLASSYQAVVLMAGSHPAGRFVDDRSYLQLVLEDLLGCPQKAEEAFAQMERCEPFNIDGLELSAERASSFGWGCSEWPFVEEDEARSRRPQLTSVHGLSNHDEG